MSRSQRRAHRIVWMALSLLLPALIALSLASRHAPRSNGIRWEEFR